MATTVDTLLVRIEADMTELKKSLDKVQRDVDKASRGIGAKFRQLGNVFKGVLGVLAVQQAARAGMSMINLASDIEEMQGKSRVVFGAFRDQVVSDLEEFGNAVGRSTFELEGMASSIQDTFVPMGFARGEAAKLSTELTKLAVDVASFNNASDTETMEAFQSALVGNHETVRRFGVVITEATLNQELMRMGIEKGTKAATNAQKVQARLNLITKGTSDAHGDAARTADSFANQTRALLAELNELAAGLTARFLPAVTQVVAAMRQGAEATKRFLQELGIIEMPVADELVFVSAQINELENKLVSLRQAEESAKDGADEMYGAYSGYGVDGAKNAVNDLTAQVEALKGRRDELSEAIVMGQFIPAANMGFEKTEPTQEEIDAADALKDERIELQALSKAKREEFKLERDLKIAIAEGNKEKIKEAHFNQILYDLKKDFPELTKQEITALTDKARIQADLIMKEAELTDSLDAKKKAQDAYNASAQDGLSYVLSNIRTSQELEETLKDVKAAYDAGKISTDEFALAQEQIKEKIAELDPVYKQMKDRANEAFDSVATSIADMVMSGSFDLKKLGDLFKQTMRQMIADALAAAVIKPILRSIFGAVGMAIGGPAGAFIGSIGGSAGGGSVSPYAPEIVGERGPELIVPKSASRILNNHDTKNALGMGSSTTIVQNINISTGVQQTVRSEIRSLMPEIANSAKAAVADSKRRGGSYGRAFA